MSNPSNSTTPNQQQPQGQSSHESSDINSDEQIKHLVKVVNTALDDMKAVDIVELDIRELSNIADMMIVASGNSQRHVKAIADTVLEKVKAAAFKPIGIEGTDVSEWILLDLGDVIVHIMLPKTRSFYDLEKLWSARPSTKPKDDTPQLDDPAHEQ